MHATHRSKRRNRGRTMDAAPSQGISSGRLTSGRNRVMSSGGSGGCEKFVGEGGGVKKKRNVVSTIFFFFLSNVYLENTAISLHLKIIIKKLEQV